LKCAGLIDDETGVEFTITHTFVDPPERRMKKRIEKP
jgi:hypothetical protein